MAQLASATSSPASYRMAAVRPPRRSSNVRVVVDWSSSTTTADDVHSHGHVELIAHLDAGVSATWSCLSPSSGGWEQAISASGCDEVVLTTWLGNEPLAKDMVLDLAEHLTQRFKGSRSVIRVRFLPREKRRAA